MSAKHFKRILVTGASGFIGGRLARVLTERGYTIRALYRREIMPEHLKRTLTLGAEVEQRDLTRIEHIHAAVRDIDAVIHAAGLTGDWGSYNLFKRFNYKLTVQLIKEAEENGCRVFVYLSSIAVHGFGRHFFSNEEGPYYRHINPYQITKKMAEEHVIAMNSKTLRTAVIRPGNVYGPGDTTTFYRIFDAQKRGIMGTLGGGKTLTCPVYVEDLIEAIILCLEKEDSGGEVFNITGAEEVTWKEILNYTSYLLNVNPPRVNLPVPVARFFACSLSGLYKLFHIKSDPPLTPYRVSQLAYDYHFSIAKAQDLLGYRPCVDWREGMRRAVEAFCSEIEASG